MLLLVIALSFLPIRVYIRPNLLALEAAAGSLLHLPYVFTPIHAHIYDSVTL